MEDFKEKLELILKKIRKTDEAISPEKDLFKDLGLTSLHVVELIAMIEDEFDIMIPMNEIQHIKTVKDLYVEMEKWLQLRN